MNKLDILNVEIKIGDRVVYGKSDRDNPIKLGYVVGFDEDKGTTLIIGDGNLKAGGVKNNEWHRKILVINNLIKDMVDNDEQQYKTL